MPQSIKILSEDKPMREMVAKEEIHASFTTNCKRFAHHARQMLG